MQKIQKEFWWMTAEENPAFQASEDEKAQKATESTSRLKS